jgi:hypothetical protein
MVHQGFSAAAHDQYVRDIFSGKFTPSSFVLSVNETAEFSFSISPTLDSPDVTITTSLPAFVTLLAGTPVWRGPVVVGQLVKLQFSIRVKEDFSGSIGARVEALNALTNYYILPVRTTSIGGLQAQLGNPANFVRGKTNAGTPNVTQPSPQFSVMNAPSPGGYITVRGTFVYQVDLTGYCPGKVTPPYQGGSVGYCPMRRVEVVLYDNEPISLREVSRTTTDDNGNYVFAGVSNNGFLFGGLNVYVEALSTNLKTVYDLSTPVASSKPSNGAGYAVDTPQVNNVPDGSIIDYGIRYPTQYNEAWESIDAVLREYDWIRSNSGTGWSRGSIDIWWPYGEWPVFTGSNIQLNDRSDPSSYGYWNHYVLYHEYGHAVMFTAYGNNLPSGAGPPPSDPCYPNHCIFSETSGQYALVEGFAEFMQAAVDNTPEIVQDYYNGHGGNLEANDWYNCVDTGDIDGNVVEGSVASVFWDIFDPDIDDTLRLGFGPIWNVLVNSNPQQLYPDFWNAWFQRYDYSNQMTQIFVNYGVLAPTVTVTSTLTETATSYSYGTTTTTVTSYTSTSTSTSTIPTLTTVVLVPLTVTSTAQSTQYLTSTLTTTVTSYTSTQTSTSTISTTVALVPLTMTSTVQSTQLLTSTTTTTVTSYTATTTSTSTSVVYTTVTVSPGGAGAAASSPVAYLALLSLFVIPVGRFTVGKGRRILRVRSLMGRRCPRS